jgi:hypothetical protein
MKTTLKLSNLLVAIASVFTLSSCLSDNNNENTSHANYSSYVTITGNSSVGYTFYSDFGCILRPTSASVQEVLPGLSNSNAKRAYVAFNLIPESENGKNLEKGMIYDIALVSSYYANYGIPTYNTLELSTVKSDSLITKNKYIQKVDKNIWGANGYVNALMTLNYQQNKPFYLTAYYDKEQDIVPETNTLYLNLYYNNNSNEYNAQGQAVISFDLPEEITDKFSSDSVNIVLRAITDYNDNILQEVGNCSIAISDFYTPSF